MEGRTSGFVSLVGPSDNSWHVELIQQNNDLFLHDGWPEFVRDHSIECGDSLVFRYDGNLHFTVHVFDQSSCEKEAAFHAECSQDPGGMDEQLSKKRERESTTISKDKIFEGVPKKMRGSSCHLHSEGQTKNMEDKMDKSNKEACECGDLIMTEKCQEEFLSNETKTFGSPSKDSLCPMPSQPKSCNEKQGNNPLLFNIWILRSILAYDIYAHRCIYFYSVLLISATYKSNSLNHALLLAVLSDTCLI